jgi:hypothetical protein
MGLTRCKIKSVGGQAIAWGGAWEMPSSTRHVPSHTAFSLLLLGAMVLIIRWTFFSPSIVLMGPFNWQIASRAGTFKTLWHGFCDTLSSSYNRISKFFPGLHFNFALNAVDE